MENPQYVDDILVGGSSLDITAPGTISEQRSVLLSVSCAVAGSAGVLALNDCAALDDADASNTVISIPYSRLVPGTPLKLDWPCETGLTVSAIPTGATIGIAWAAVD